MGHYWAELDPKGAQRKYEMHQRVTRAYKLLADVPLSRFTVADLKWLMPMQESYNTNYWSWIDAAEEWINNNLTD